jgi:hypothetical protein
VGVTTIAKEPLYVLNHCTRFLARDASGPRHDFGQYAPGDARAAICEAWRFPIVDSHWDGSSAATSFAFNDVTFVYDARGQPGAEVAVVGTFGALWEPVPLRPVEFLGAASGFHSVTVRVPKGQVHTYKLKVGDGYVVDPINPQRTTLDNGQVWSRFFTDACQLPIVLTRRERELLGRIVAQLLPFREAENSRFIRSVYNSLDRGARTQEFPLAYRLDEDVGVVNYIDKLIARAEQHNADDYRTCLSIIDGVLRSRYGGLDPLMLPADAYADLHDQMRDDRVDGWDYRRYGSPRWFLLLLRRHAMTGAFAHPKAGGNSGAAGWMYLEDRFRDERGETLFDWRRAIEAPLGHNTDYRG